MLSFLEKTKVRVHASLIKSVWRTQCGILAVPALALCSCTQDQDTGDNTGTDEQKTPVTICRVQKRVLHETVRGIGTLLASETVEIRPEIGGPLTEVHFAEGARVEKGQLLFTIDDTKLRRRLASQQAALAAAAARRKNAADTYRRMQALYERDAVSEDERDRAETQYETAQAEVERLKAEVAFIDEQMDDTRITAPFTGAISERQADPGDFVKIGEKLATLYRASEMEITFTVPERYMGRIHAGQNVKAMVEAYPDRTFEGEVIYVSPSITTATRGLAVKASITNHDDKLRPGAFAAAVVTIAEHPDRAVVPEDALVPVRRGYIVYVVADGKAHRREVTAGIREGTVVEVREGLEDGERVVLTGQMRLADGNPVKVTSREECELGERL